MGVPGLWEYINRVGTSTSLAKLAVDAFEKNSNGMRAYRVGIDANIWMTHAEKSTDQGENPQVRTLFFRVARLVHLPIVPLFVFDGRSRPNQKRGSRKGKSGSHALSQQFKDLLKCFGMEWREALGEAEAELAYLNQIGQVDAIITDDVDTFVFGAKVLLKNQNAELSGNKKNPALNVDGKPDKLHYMVYKADDIKNNPNVSLTRGGMILFSILSGGDYSKGLEGFGPVISYALARCGFGDELLSACQNLPPMELREYLAHWRVRVNAELRENKKGFLRHRTNLVLPDSFPSVDILEKYAKPVTSELQGSSGSTALRDRTNVDLASLAAFCEKNFEWACKKVILERFRKVIWPCTVMHVLRRSALESDQRPAARDGVGTSPTIVKRFLGKESSLDRVRSAFVNQGVREDTALEVGNFPSLILKITTTRQHPSTDKTLEYRIEVSPLQIVNIASSGIKGTRQPLPEKARKKDPDPPEKPFLLWIPASIMERVHPAMVADYLANKNKKVKGKKTQQTSSNIPSEDEDDYAGIYRSSSPVPPIPSSPYSNYVSGSQSRSQPPSQSQSRSLSASQSASQLASRSTSQTYSRAFSPGPCRSQSSARPIASSQPHVQPRPQPRAQAKARTRPDVTEPLFVLDAVLEPWFTAPSLPLGRVNKHQLCRGFYFTFQNPDSWEPVEEEPAIAQQPVIPQQPTISQEPAIPQQNRARPREQALFVDDEDFDWAVSQRLDNMEVGGYEDEQPRNNVERLFDQIILAPNTKKAAKRKATARGPAPKSQPPAKRARTSLLSVLDALEFD